jgi:hypothetical protein
MRKQNIGHGSGFHFDPIQTLEE